MQSARADVKLGSTLSVLVSFQQTFILGSQKARWGLKHSAEKRQRYGKLYDRLSLTSHLQVAQSKSMIKLSVLGRALWELF